MADRSEWTWMPHPAHFICANNCRFHLATHVGGYVVSTVGEYVPDESVREITASSRGVTLVGQGDDRLADFLARVGFVEIGRGRIYETMVFRAKAGGAECCPFEIADFSEIDFRGHTAAGAARRGHLELCAKWSADVPAIVGGG